MPITDFPVPCCFPRGAVTMNPQRQRRRSLFTLWAAVLFVAAACSAPGQPAPIFGYRVEAGNQISVLTSTAPGWQTWVYSTEEASDRVVVHVRTRDTQVGAGAPVAERIWLSVPLKEPLGTRTVIDGAANTAVAPAP